MSTSGCRCAGLQALQYQWLQKVQRRSPVRVTRLSHPSAAQFAGRTDRGRGWLTISIVARR